jgi:cobalt-zinc-cadmium resistance protein CzcA
MEEILKTFPEVKQVVSRIGAAEVPTDPMSMEESDVIIKLRPKKEWVTADTKDGLADKFKEALSAIPGIEVEFTQPIEMRFNELITGVRADLAIKIFGEDLDLLYAKAVEIRDAIDNVPGAADISIEKVVGLPQVSIRYDRARIARYGLSVDAINDMISLGFAGMPAGTILEGEKQFDLVIRFDETHRRSIERLATTPVETPTGHELPLGELAEITFAKGPAKISRDNTMRRIVVGVNVRNRDLESVVKDVQAIIERDIDLPTGYSVDYGGQFENLRSARSRLMVAVPIALVLIFLLLFFAFDSVRDAMLIYSAIPLATVGGIVLLYLRDMPFSISAGVGFIALFGIAVLNGIVLIEEFKELKAHGMTDMDTRIITGAHNRLRPVLLTATAAALGFLPMAISTSAGAEIQRPLATVVIGGLITATILTLIVLPVLYALVDRHGHPPKRKHGKAIALGILPLLLAPALSQAQVHVTADEAFRLAMQSNSALKASASRIDQADQLVKTSFNPDKAGLYYMYDDNNVAVNGLPIHVWGISQPFSLPGYYNARKSVLQQEALMAMRAYNVDTFGLHREIAKAYQQLVHAKAIHRHQHVLDSLHTGFAEAARKRFDAGETPYLELVTAQALREQIKVQLRQAEEDIRVARTALNQLIQGDTIYDCRDSQMTRLILWPLDTAGHPGLAWQDEAVRLAAAQTIMQKKTGLPGIDLEAFMGTNNGENAELYPGVRAGVTVPLFAGEQRARVKASRTGEMIAWFSRSDFHRRLVDERQRLLAALRPLDESLAYYESTGRGYMQELRKHAYIALTNGEIDYIQYLQLLQTAQEVDKAYLNDLLTYNLTVIDANFVMP